MKEQVMISERVCRVSMKQALSHRKQVLLNEWSAVEGGWKRMKSFLLNGKYPVNYNIIHRREERGQEGVCGLQRSSWNDAGKEGEKKCI